MPEILQLSGGDASDYVEHLARLRIEVFREYPYLYDGDLAYEVAYVDTFLQARQNFMAVVKDGDAVVGASTGLPLVEETDNIKAPFLEAGWDITKIFYFGESVLLPAYRGQGIGKQFLELREQFARQQGFSTLTFCAVVRPDDHKMQPDGYRPLDPLWRKQGFQPEDLHCLISWQEVGEAEESAKSLQFWIKQL
ncbi:MAG: GNAT family N-acetyltransferase [Phaeodactylibacter sp.]|uniref:GNAT family N-acetyltransferase n=1 Tax=Phaeodactylibacter sp. TaxID=1940289 RepID=UPI0032ED75D6